MGIQKKKDNHGLIFIILWVDDVVLIAENQHLIFHFIKHMSKVFKVKDLGPLKQFLGIEFRCTSDSVQMSQTSYTEQILERFGMTHCNSTKLPCVKNIHDELRANEHCTKLDRRQTTKYRELVGSLIYLEQVTRPDLSYIVNILGQHMHEPTSAHWNLGTKVLKYLKYSKDFSINYFKSEELKLFGYCDADYANMPNRKSQSGYIFYLNSLSSPISWSSRKQRLVATSTTNAEYIALSEACCEALYLQKLLSDLNLNINYYPTEIYCDNTSALSLAHNPENHRRSKHIDVKYHHVRNHVELGDIILSHVKSQFNLADGFTKSLPNNLFQFFMKNLHKGTYG